MAQILLKLNDLFKSLINYETLNNINKEIKLRKNKKVSINDAVLLRLLSSGKDSKKNAVVADINHYKLNNNYLYATKKAYRDKENNISVDYYSLLFKKLVEFHKSNCGLKNENGKIYLAVDGTNNHDKNINVMLNMGYYDITNKVPIDLTHHGSENRNKEVQMLLKEINNNIDNFSNTIIIGDRFYFSYELLHKLYKNNISFIIRAKKKGELLENNTKINQNYKHYQNIMDMRPNIRVIKFSNKMKKTVYSKSGKKEEQKIYYIEQLNDCVILTNLMDKKMYPDDLILDAYRSRWEIETYFKFVKRNFNFEHMVEKKEINYRKINLSIMIMSYILKIVEYSYGCENNKKSKSVTHISKNIKHTEKINNSQLMKGIFSTLIYDLIYGTLTKDKIEIFLKSYVDIVKNKVDRHFIRNSKRPFSKWYVKGYSSNNNLVKILRMMEAKNTKKMNKNQKLIAKNIKIIKIITKQENG